MADVLALLTREEAYDALNDPTSARSVPTSDRDGEVVDLWVPALSRRIDQLCGPVVSRSVTERHSGGCDLALRTAPVLSVTTVHVDGSLVASSGYELNIDNRWLPIVEGTFAAGTRNVTVVFAAGRYASTATVDPLFKMAAGAILRRLWSREAGAWARGGSPFEEAAGGMVGFYKAVDPMVSEFLGGELLPPGVG
jgi:hypothetical protein